MLFKYLAIGAGLLGMVSFLLLAWVIWSRGEDGMDGVGGTDGSDGRVAGELPIRAAVPGQPQWIPGSPSSPNTVLAPAAPPVAGYDPHTEETACVPAAAEPGEDAEPTQFLVMDDYERDDFEDQKTTFVAIDDISARIPKTMVLDEEAVDGVPKTTVLPEPSGQAVARPDPEPPPLVRPAAPAGSAGPRPTPGPGFSMFRPDETAGFEDSFAELAATPVERAGQGGDPGFDDDDEEGEDEFEALDALDEFEVDDTGQPPPKETDLVHQAELLEIIRKARGEP